MERLLKDLFVVPQFDESKVRVTFTVPAGCTIAQWEIFDEDKCIAQDNIDTRRIEKAEFEAEMPDFKPWNVNSPYLYTLKMLLILNGKPVEMTESFGMRKIHATKDHIYVNNEKFCVRGYIRGRDAHDHPNFENLPLEEYYAKNIRNAKKYGFNMMRFHSRVPLQECFRAADKLGMFIHIEIRDYYGKYQKERSMMNDEGELISNEKWGEVILKHRNHPSLMVYCMGNEIRHPGTNPQVAEISSITKQLDPTRLFIDTCAHGEFDRNNVDIDVQHMSYFYPFGKNYDMFDNTYNWYIYGSAKGSTLVEKGTNGDGKYEITRALDAKHPILAHEVCHYVSLHDIEALDQKFTRLDVERPWWIDELKKLVSLKGLQNDYPQMLAASKRFQFLSWKLGIEAARRSPLLCGLHFLQLADTERYENSNGILDCFDDSKGVDEDAFMEFNSDTVILADLPQRTFFEAQSVSIPVLVSHFSPDISGMAAFSFTLESKNDDSVRVSGKLPEIDLDSRGRFEIATINIDLPTVDQPKDLVLTCGLIADDSSYEISNSWNLWLYPDRPAELKTAPCTIEMNEVNPSLRYHQLRSKGTLDKPEKLLMVNRFSKEVFTHLENGGDVVMLYRVPQTRDRKVRAKREKYTLPATWDRLKAVIWDRGTNCGAFMRASDALAGFPNDGYVDLQFHGLIDDCDKIILDDFPCDVSPIMQGVDKAVRDRYDVYTYKLSELQPEWTMRKFGYMFELKIGKGRLFVTGFNFTGLNYGKPETCAMFESIMRYVTSDSFDPKTQLSAKQLEDYLLKKSAEPLAKERKMTQFWQLNDTPLESDQYWIDAEDYLAED